MASSTFNKRDLNRFRKVYPWNRKRERLSIVPDAESFKIEVGTATLTNEDAKTVNFTESFTSTPIVTAISIDSESNNTANVNVFIGEVSKTAVTFQTSMSFTGTIHFHAIQVS